MRIPPAVNVVLLVVATTAFYAYIGRLVPQKEVHPPEDIVMSADMTTDELIPIGEQIANGKGLCLTCTTLGTVGLIGLVILTTIGSTTVLFRASRGEVLNAVANGSFCFAIVGTITFEDPRAWAIHGELMKRGRLAAVIQHDGGVTVSGATLRFSLAWLIPPFAYLPAAFCVRRWRKRWRRMHGRCIECGYDLTGNTTGTCPECGASAAARSTFDTKRLLDSKESIP